MCIRDSRPACAYDYQPLEAIVAEHFDFFDLTMAEPGGEEPVSYTHLDVYKRQVRQWL